MNVDVGCLDCCVTCWELLVGSVVGRADLIVSVGLLGMSV